MSLLIIDRDTVHDLLPMVDCIALMRQAMIALSTGQTRQLLRQIIGLDEGAAFGVMPGVSAETFGAKLISVYPGNFAKGLQSHQGCVALFDPATGDIVAMLHAGEITAIRTAAASAAATKVLARPNARRLAILGYGEQALTHARAIALVRPLGEIGEVFSGAKVGRADRMDVTVYKSLGAVVQDLFSGWHIYRQALAKGRGVVVPF